MTAINESFFYEDSESEQYRKLKAGNNLAPINSSKDSITLALESNYNKLKQKHGDSYKTWRFITTKELIEAPENFFDRFESTIKRVKSSVQGSISANPETSALIREVHDDPTDEARWVRAYDAIISRLNEEMNATPFRGIDKFICTSLVLDEMLGLSRISPLYRDESIQEIVCNGPKDIQVMIDGVLYKVPSCKFTDVAHMKELLDRIYGRLNKKVSAMTPRVKGRLWDFSRIYAVDNTVAPTGPTLNIRRHNDEYITPKKYVEWGGADKKVMEFLGNMIYAGASFAVLGGTSSGKALHKDTLLPTVDTDKFGRIVYKPISEVIVGDKILDNHGGTTTIKAKYHPYALDHYKFVFDNGQTVYTCGEHLWTFLADNNLTGVNSISAPLDAGGRFTVNTRRAYEMFRAGGKLSVPLIKPVQYPKSSFMFNKEVTNQIAYSASIPPELITASVWDREEFVLLFLGYDKLSNKIKPALRIKGDCLGELSLVSEDVASLQCSKQSYPIEQIVQAVESGNSISSDTGCLYTVLANRSEDLVRDAHEICAALGYYTTTVQEKVLPDGSTGYYFLVDFNVASYTVKTLEPLGVNSSAEDLAYDSYDDYYCIEVDNPEKLFACTGSYLLTHNTTVLSALTGFIRPDLRVLTIEDNIEMVPCPTKLLAPAMETLAPRPDTPGDKGVTMNDLVVSAMQMAPKWLVMGEVTEGDATVAMLQALNTGHSGATTFHADSIESSAGRLIDLVSNAGHINPKTAIKMVAQAFDFFIQTEAFPIDGSRRITAIAEAKPNPVIDPDNGELMMEFNYIMRFHTTGIDENGKVTGFWKVENKISQYRANKMRLGTIGTTLNWDQLQLLSSGIDSDLTKLGFRRTPYMPKSNIL